VALAGAGRPEEVDRLAALDEAELRERQDPVPVQLVQPDGVALCRSLAA
jgi:hypothetical protein